MHFYEYEGTDLSFIEDINYTHIQTGMGGMEYFFKHFNDLPDNVFHSPILDSAVVCHKTHNCLPVTSYSMVFYDGYKIVAQAIKKINK